MLRLRNEGESYRSIKSKQDLHLHHHQNRQRERGSEVLKVLLGIAIGVFIYANLEARQITADLLRATVMHLLLPMRARH